jgi:hypothetical protein
MLVAGVVIVVLAVASFVETPGTVEGIGIAVVIVAMGVVILRERTSER